MDFKKYVRDVKGRSDLTDIFIDPVVFSSVIAEMAKPFLNERVDKVVALDALGFVFGSRIAEEFNAGLVLMRKSGKLAIDKKISVPFVDYSGTNKTFEIPVGVINDGDQTLIVDDWSETGTQLKVAVELVESVGGKVMGITCFNIDKEVRADIRFSKYRLSSVIN